MATLYTSYVNVGGSIRLKVEYSVQNYSTEVSATVRGTVYVEGSLGENTARCKNVTLTIDGIQTISPTTNETIRTVPTTIQSFNQSINKTTAARDVTITISGELAGTYGSYTSVSKSGTVSIPALQHYDIYYYTNGGSGSAKHYDGYYKQKHSIISLATSGFSRTGYTFLGWAQTSSSSAAAYVAGDNVTVTSNLNFYAVWKINSYTLTANANSGSISSTSGWSGTGNTATKSLNYGSAYGTFPTVSKSYYDLKGWYTAASGGSAVSTSTTIGASNTTIYAQWTPTSYSISYTLNGGSASNPTTYTIESANFTLTNPTRTGYTFKGWSGTGLSGDSNKTVTITKGSTGARSYTANWTANTYTLTINPQSGTYNNTTSNSTKTMTYDSTNNNNIGKPTKTGYTFKGWYTSTGGGGTQVFTDSGAYNSNATSYWSSGKWHSAAALTVYAYWTINSYTLTANANNGSISSTSGWTGTGSTATKSVTYGNAYGTLPTVSRSYYTLKGWYTASSGGSAVSTSTTIGASNTTIYAQWTGADYTISLNNQSATSGGTSSIFTRYATGIYLDSNHATAMTTSTNPITVPTRTGYTFKGYYTSTNGGGTQVISNTGYITTAFTNTLFHANSTIYVYWTINSHTLTANGGGGSILSTTGWSGTGSTATKSVTYGQKYDTLPAVDWKNHSFNKWVNSSGNTVNKDTIMGDEPVTITAQWIGDKVAPVFEKTPQIQRCTNVGNYDDENEYCRIVITSIDGYHYQNDSNNTVTDSTTFSAKYRIQNTGDYATAYLKKIQEDTTVITGDTAATSKSITAGKATIYLVTNSSGTPIQFDTQKVYDFEVTLTSTNGQFVTKAGFLSAAYFPFDVNANATAIGLFRIAPDNQEGLFVNKAATFDSTINNFLIRIPASNLDANAVKDYNGIWVSSVPITNAPISNHGVLLGISQVGTPFQFYIPDSTNQYIYKRSWDNTNSVWRDWAKLSAGYADALTHKTLNSTTINNTAGSFAFSGSGEPWAGTDWVGFQIGDSVDKFQFTRNGVAPMFRYNDSGGTNSSDWSSWVTLYSTGNKPTAADVGALSLSGGTVTGSVSFTEAASFSKGATGLTRHYGNLNSLGSGTPAAATKDYFVNSVAQNQTGTAYNTSGSEFVLLFGRGGNYGTTLKFGYDDLYLYKLRYKNSSWLSNDWEKISAGYADSAGSSKYLSNEFTVGSGTNSHATAIQNWFNANKASIARDVAIGNYSSASSNGSMYMGYFLSGYDTSPYGGFFVAHYNTPRYVGINNGTFTDHLLLSDKTLTKAHVTTALGYTPPTIGTTATTAAAGNHTHSYLPLSGGTLTGILHITANGVKTDFGCQGSNFCHIYTDASNGFAFDKSFAMVGNGTIGTTGYPTGNIIMKYGGELQSISASSGSTVRTLIKLHSATGITIGAATIKEVKLYGSLLPQGSTSGERYLGDSSNKWSYVYASNGTIQTSDKKNKDILGTITDAKQLILSLKPINYMWKDGDHRRIHMGFVAQDIATICKKLNKNLALTIAHYKNNENKLYYGENVDDALLNWGLNYQELIAPIVAVIQEQQKEIEQLKKEIQELKK